MKSGKRGAEYYETGKPCGRGHIAPRLVSTRTCTECQRETREAWRQKNPEKHKAHGNAWRAHNSAYFQQEHVKERMRNFYRKKKGIPPATRPTPERCECCNEPFRSGKATHLDHDHVTGKFRGWLCNRCNMGLGNLGDSIEGVERAIAYLRRADLD